jgi:lambda family phage tail tape measure protein
MDDFHVQARNFTSLGKEMANSLSTGLGNAFSDIALGTEKASQAFANFGKSMLQTATQMMMQKAVQMMLGSVFGGFGGFLASSASSEAMAFHNATSTKRATGGLLAGPPSSKDNLLIQAATGEYVLRASAVQKFGAAHFDAYNRGELPASVRGYATGGVVGSPMMPSSSSGGKPGVNVSVTVNVQKDGATTSSVESSDGAEKFGANLAAFVQNQILLAKRQGGQLARQR